jgi:gliding motility-associated-like protein
VPFLDTLITYFLVDYFRTELDTSVCQGRNITLPTLAGDTTIYDVQTDLIVQFGTFQSASGCDSIVAWKITMNPYITEEYEITACDSVIWGDLFLKKPGPNIGLDSTLQRVFLNKTPNNYCCDCDTLKKLAVTIIDSATLKMDFSQEDFCKGDDMQGFIELETNFTAFDWIFYKDKEQKRDSTWTAQETTQDILNPGYYYVKAYMDTSLYEILTDLRIFDVDCYLKADTLVADCPLIVPNVITPNGDEVNQFFGIKKLNLERDNELTIYDRWGKIVFQQKNYQCIFKGGQFHNTEEAFEGLSRGGQKLPDGAYYYAIKYDALGDKVPKKYSGTLMILR